MVYLPPDQPGAITSFPDRYDNFIGGKWVAPLDGEYFDVDLALDTAHAAAEAWGRASITERSNTLLRIADRMEAHLEELAIAETWDNGKAVRETLAADLPLAVDHFPTSPVRSAPRKGPSARSTRTRSPTTSTNRSAWSGRSSRGTSRC